MKCTDRNCTEYGIPKDGSDADELFALKSQIEKYEEALSYYADYDNWVIDQERTNEANKDSKDAALGIYTSIWKDASDAGISLGHITNTVGGKRARTVLADFGKRG